MRHASEIFYTNWDDGIWLKCTPCSWEVNLGFFPTIEEVERNWHTHIAAIQPAPDTKDG